MGIAIIYYFFCVGAGSRGGNYCKSQACLGVFLYVYHFSDLVAALQPLTYIRIYSNSGPFSVVLFVCVCVCV